MRFLHLTRLFGGFTLGLLLACGGHENAPETIPPATSIIYTDPPAKGWRLVKDPTSTPTRLVLALVGPSGSQGRGVGFNLLSGAPLTFGRFTDGAYIQDTGVFKLRSVDAPPEAYDPILLAAGLKQEGQLLTAGIFQKDRRQDAQALGVPLCRITLAFDPTKTPVPTETLVPLAITKARQIPADIGTLPPNPEAYDSDLRSVVAKSRLETVEIAVGSVVLR